MGKMDPHISDQEQVPVDAPSAAFLPLVLEETLICPVGGQRYVWVEGKGWKSFFYMV